MDIINDLNEYVAELKSTIEDQRAELDKLKTVIGTHSPLFEMPSVTNAIPFNPSVPHPKSRKYPFDVMQPGDSFFLAGADAAAKLNSAYRTAGAATGATFRVRSVTENGIFGARVWRTE